MNQIIKDTALMAVAMTIATALYLAVLYVAGQAVDAGLVKAAVASGWHMMVGFAGGMWVAKRNQERAR